MVATLATLARDHAFLPRPPNVGAYVTNEEEEERLLEWLSTKHELESPRRWETTFYGGLAATGVGVLLATIWSDVPAVRSMRVYASPTRTVVTTSLVW